MRNWFNYTYDNDMYNEDWDIYCGHCGYVWWGIEKKTKRHFRDWIFFWLLELVFGKIKLVKETYQICPKCGSNYLVPATEDIKNYKRPKPPKTLDEQMKDFYREVYWNKNK